MSSFSRQCLSMTHVFLLIASVFLAVAPTAFGQSAPEDEFWNRYQQLKTGPSYTADVPRSRVVTHYKPVEGGYTYYYAVDVPADYSPDKQWPVHFYLHGGIESSSNKIGDRTIGSLDELRQDGVIAIYPSAWSARAWWHEEQADNLLGILSAIKQQYNVDENRVFVLGISDGGTGAFYVASRYPTAFAGFVSLIGSVRVLHTGNNPYGTSFYNNFIGKPIFAVNTTRDPLYPADEQEPIMRQIQDLGGKVEWLSVKGKHNLRWYSEVDGRVRSFLQETRRNPFPDYVRWQIDKGREFTRNHWLQAGELVDSEEVGLVDATRRGNEIFVNSVNMADATVLLSPEVIDFEQPIRIWVNRELVFNSRMAPSLATLEKWYALDRDRSMLIGREVKVLLSATEPQG